MAGLIHYKFDERTIEWMMLRSGEVDLPRDPDNFYNLAYRSVRYDNTTNNWQYYMRKVGGQHFAMSYRPTEYSAFGIRRCRLCGLYRSNQALMLQSGG